MGSEPFEDIRLVERRAVARAAVSPSGIGVAVVRAVDGAAGGPPRLSCRVSDGSLFAWLELEPADAAATPSSLESAVEHWAADLPVDDRLLALERLSPLRFPPAA